MNNGNEDVKEYDEALSDNLQSVEGSYHAVQNQNIINQNNVFNNNTSGSVPNFINQNSSVNIVPEVNNTVNVINNGVNDSVIPLGNQESIQNTNNQQLYDTTNFIKDSDKTVPTRTKKATVKINPELKTVVLMALILLLAMSFIPTIFDWFDSLKLKIFG